MLKNRFVQVALLLAVAVVLVGVAFAAAPKTYQVTGPVIALTDDTITVAPVKYQGEKWEIARSADTKVTGDLKVGSKVTVVYRMTAVSIDVKAATAPKGGKTKS